MITINGVTIASPTTLERGKFRVSRAERTASGAMQLEIVAIKHRLDLTWAKLADADYRVILDLLEAAAFHTVVYPDPQLAGGTRSIRAYVGDITDAAWHTVGGVRWWDHVRLALIEQ